MSPKRETTTCSHVNITLDKDWAFVCLDCGHVDPFVSKAVTA